MHYLIHEVLLRCNEKTPADNKITQLFWTALILLCTPILLPVVQSFGMSTTHFGVMMVYNLCVGLCTPPVGNALFVGCSVGKTTIEKVTKALLPLYATMVVGLVLVTFFPPIVEFLPKMMGYAV